MLINGYKLVWQDEFNGDILDEDTWFRYSFTSHNANKGTTHKCSDSIKNSYVEGGCLHMVGIDEGDNVYSGCELQTKNSMLYKYGYLEISAKLGKGPSAFSAFWLNSSGLPFDRLPEVDIYENFGRDNRIASNLHRWWYDKDENGKLMFGSEHLHHDQFASQVDWTLRNSWLPEGENFYDKFHRFGLDWTPERMDFYLDGVCYVSIDITGEYFKDFHQPMFVILSHQIRGNLSDENTESHKHDIVEYIKIYKRENGILIDPRKDEITL